MAKKLATKVGHDELDALLGDRVPNNSYPYPSGSDLLELWLWQQRIELRIQETRPATEYEHWLYLPHELADKARASLSVKYPLIFKRVDELLDFVRQADRDFDDGMASESDLFNAMGSLSDKIETAIKIVADDRDTQAGSRPKPALTKPRAERDDTPTEADLIIARKLFGEATKMQQKAFLAAAKKVVWKASNETKNAARNAVIEEHRSK